MHTRQKLFALLAVATVVLTAFGPAVGAGMTAGNDGAGNDGSGDAGAGNDSAGNDSGANFAYDEERNHGRNVAAYVHWLQSGDRMTGLLVAKFTAEHNAGEPGFPDAVAVNASSTGGDGTASAETAEGEERDADGPARAGTKGTRGGARGNGGGQGPPAHANAD